MTCEQAMDLLSPWLDGELDPEQREALEAHLETCPDCKALADALRGLDDKLTNLREPAPQSLKQGVLYKIDQATGKAKKPRSRWFGPGTAIGAVAAVLVLLVGTGVIPLKAPVKSDAAKPAATEYAEQAPETQKDALAPAPAEANGEDWESPVETNGLSDGETVIVAPSWGSQHLAADTRPPEAEYNGMDEVTQDTWYRGGNVKGPEEPQPVTDKTRSSCANLSANEEAMVLLYTEFDFKSLFGLLEVEQPELFALVEKLEPEERDGMIVFKTDCGTALAIHEWLLEHLPHSEVMDAELEEAETNLRIRMEGLDPGSGSLYKIITWAPPTHATVWPEDWPQGWAVRIRTGENWELFFPAESYTPNAEKTAYLAFAN